MAVGGCVVDARRYGHLQRAWQCAGRDSAAIAGSARVQSIVTHGRLASCDGYLQNGPDRTPFSHAIRFAGATKSAKIAEIRTYMIAREGT